MHKIVRSLAAVGACLLLAQTPASAQVIFQESFAYPAGNLQGSNGGTGFTTAWDQAGTDAAATIGAVTNAQILAGSINPAFGSGNRVQVCLEPGKSARFDRSFPTTLTTDGVSTWFGFWYRSTTPADNSTFGIAGQLILMNSANSSVATDMRLGFGKTSNFTGPTGVNTLTAFTRASTGGCAAQNWPGTAAAATALNLPSNGTYYILVKISRAEFVNFNIGTTTTPNLATLDGVRVWFLTQPPTGSTDPIFTSKPNGDINFTDANTQQNVPIQTRLLRGGADNTGNTNCKKDGVNGIRIRLEGGAPGNVYCAEFDEMRMGLNLESDVLLPARITALSGLYNGVENILQWATSQEVNNKGFEIERSANGLSFEKIGFVPAQGGSQGRYRFADANAQTAYYRLKQIDMNGAFSYSQIIKIEAGKKVSVKVLPNPATEQLTIQLAQGSFGKADATITDMSGRVLLSKPMTGALESINIRHLASGSYLLTTTVDGVRQTQTIVKQ